MVPQFGFTYCIKGAASRLIARDVTMLRIRPMQDRLSLRTWIDMALLITSQPLLLLSYVDIEVTQSIM